jgi:Chalcone isomerase-like
MKRLGFALALAVAVPAAALDVNGVNVADTATVAGTPLVLNGAGVRSKVIFKVYVASLYVPAKTTTLAGVLAGPRRVQLNMLRTLEAETLLEALQDGMMGIMKAFGEVKEGAVVTIDFAEDTTTISLNGKPRGTIAGAAFNTALVRIWLGPKPVQGDLKTALLKG